MSEHELILNENGAPVLLAVGAPRMDKSGISIQSNVRSGNPWRDPASGTFGNGPQGVKVSVGVEIMKRMSPQAALYITQMKNKVGAKEIQVRMVGTKAEIVMLNAQGTRVARLVLPVAAEAKQPTADGTPRQSGERDTGNRDEVVDEARSKKAIDKISAEARVQRVNDLIDYLYARYNASGAIFNSPGEVKVDAPAGWDRKTIAGLTDGEMAEVARRLGSRGWNDKAFDKILFANISATRRNKILGRSELDR